jgi:8-oxo-dGTP diphosphatase
MPVRLPQAAWKIAKEAARHVLRRPVVGVVSVARTRDGRFLLVRRGDTGHWALPGGTLEWGETLRTAIQRELLEEGGVERCELGSLLGVYSDPKRDFRFHAVTVVVSTTIEPPTLPPDNPLEISEARLFTRGELPEELSHNLRDMLDNAIAERVAWE